MRVKTCYFPMEEKWGWSIWEGDSFVHAYTGDLCAYESTALAQGLAWIEAANKVLDEVNRLEQLKKDKP